jgi:hypothetical protein
MHRAEVPSVLPARVHLRPEHWDLFAVGVADWPRLNRSFRAASSVPLAVIDGGQARRAVLEETGLAGGGHGAGAARGM